MHPVLASIGILTMRYPINVDTAQRIIDLIEDPIIADASSVGVVGTTYFFRLSAARLRFKLRQRRKNYTADILRK